VASKRRSQAVASSAVRDGLDRAPRAPRRAGAHTIISHPPSIDVDAVAAVVRRRFSRASALHQS